MCLRNCFLSFHNYITLDLFWILCNMGCFLCYNKSMQNFISLFLLIAGFIIGLGAVTVIDLHGFLGRKSKYWTRATISAHKVTKPLIWIGTILAIIGGFLFYQNSGFSMFARVHMAIAIALLLNGIFLSFYVSPYLLKQEKSGNPEKLLPLSLRIKITISFIISFAGWWGALALFIWQIK